MKLDNAQTWHTDTSGYTWGNFCRLPSISIATPQASTWVKLLYPPTAFSFDEAWLLCEIAGDQWLAWVPEYGEIVLTLDEFVTDF